MFCNYCGAQLDPGAMFCTSCGQSLAAPAPVSALPIVPAPFAGRPLGPLVPAGEIRARTGAWLGAGWDLVKADLSSFLLASLLVLILMGVVPLILQGPLIAGLLIFCRNRILARRSEIGDIFQGFNFFVPTLVATLLIGLFTFGGMLLCIIPAFVLAGMYQFTYLFIVDKKMDFWPAMQASHAVVKNDYLGFTLFVVAGGLLNLLGILCCLVGVFLTFPIYYAALAFAYQETVGFEPDTPGR
ncbi:MAG TPA: zinc-ribbon domain-containing protein [Bryobacteraceae bacterium]|nr:zinc-ribbon domain-containing protein [Bryobacteraceae bacterium]